MELYIINCTTVTFIDRLYVNNAYIKDIRMIFSNCGM